MGAKRLIFLNLYLTATLAIAVAVVIGLGFGHFKGKKSTQCDDLLKTTYQNGQRFVRMHVVNKA